MAIAELAGFTTSNGALTLNDSEALIVTGAVNTGSGNLSLTTSAGNSMTLYASLLGTTVDLVSGGTLSQNSNGIINATTLTGSSAGQVRLTAQNVIADLGDFTVDDANFYLTDSIHLTQTGTVDAGTGTVDIVSP
jgi:fibronectin-binding autotransporter adhesin